MTLLSSLLTIKMARRLHQEAGLLFLQVFVDNSMDLCDKSEIDQPYEALDNPDVVEEGTCELFLAREMVEEERAEAEKMPGL